MVGYRILSVRLPWYNKHIEYYFISQLGDVQLLELGLQEIPQEKQLQSILS